MNCSDFNDQLDAHLDGTLAPAARREADAHLALCPACRAALGSFRALRAATATLPREIVPARDLWPTIAAEIGKDRRAADGRVAGNAARPGDERRPYIWLAAAAAVAIAAIALWPRPAATSQPGWTVASLAGTPRVNAAAVTGRGEWRIGQWLETDGASRAKFDVGSIGEVRLEPNSRLRLLGTSPTDHRLELARGTMHALIWAPPRLFFVETPSATAIDLGCAYTLEVDDRGAGSLHVTSGYVALEHGGRESLIPAGMKCTTRPGAGPGTPFAEQAPAPLRDALQRYDFESGGDRALADVLALSGGGDEITLWHLLGRVAPTGRGAVFDKLAALQPPPEGVTRDGIVAGAKVMRDRWALALGLTPGNTKTKK